MSVCSSTALRPGQAQCGVSSQLTSVLSDIAVQSAENNIDLVLELLGCAALDNQVAQLLAHGQALLPLDGIAVLLSGAPGAGSHGGECEVRVEGEKEDEALAYATRGSEYTCERVLSAGCRPNGATTDRLTAHSPKACAATIGGDSLTAPPLGEVWDRGSEVFGVHDDCISL
jgi:hypothetical protein